MPVTFGKILPAPFAAFFIVVNNSGAYLAATPNAPTTPAPL
jgi:hypothetical protein